MLWNIMAKILKLTKIETHTSCSSISLFLCMSLFTELLQSENEILGKSGQNLYAEWFVPCVSCFYCNFSKKKESGEGSISA